MLEIKSRNNSYLKHLLKLIEDKSYRDEMQKVVISGKELIEELAPFVDKGTVFSKEPWPECAKFSQVIISESVASKFSSSFLAEFPIPNLPFPKKCTQLLALDRVSDPGNLGTLMRTALALGWNGVFLLSGCCDPFNDKALRASKGAPFKIPYKKGSWEEFDQLMKDYQLTPLAADLHGKKPECFQNMPCFLILGNEGQGVSKEGKMRSKTITIPMIGPMESLNVSAAGAILMYMLGRT